jgi:drug/metabolite transporter (DMT)-like permease
MKEQTKNLIELHSAVLLFGLSGLFGKFLTISPILITLGRVIFASLSMSLFFMCRGISVKLNAKNDYAVLTSAGVFLALHWTTFFMSVQFSTVAIALLTYSTYPIFVTFIEPAMFKEKLRASSVIAAFIILIGVFLIIPEFSVHSHITLGIVCGLIASLSYAFISVLNRKYVGSYSGAVIAFYEQSTVAVLLLPALCFVNHDSLFIVKNVMLLLLLGTVFTAVAHSLFTCGLKTIKAQSASIIASLESIYGIIAAAMLLGEIPTVKEIIGGAIILGTALWITVKAKTTG